MTKPSLYLPEPALDGSVLDRDECYYDTVESYLGSLFGFCGCGIPEETLAYLMKGLELVDSYIRDDFKEWDKACDDHFKTKEGRYLVWYIFDAKELTEHGGSVPGWLTPDGKALLAYYQKQKGGSHDQA